MWTDFILNGQGHGQVGQALAHYRFDPGYMRPYFDSQGQRAVTVQNAAGKPEKRLIAELLGQGMYSPVFNATSLRKDEWIALDRVVLMAARQRLRAWADLAAASTYSGFNGMGKTILEHQTMSDAGEAVVDMDALTSGRNDTPHFQLEGTPLPIIHCDFWYPLRQLAASRQDGTPLDTVMAEQAGRRIGEVIEQLTIGTMTGPTYGDSTLYSRAPTVYGYTNFPARNTKTDLTTPTGTNPEAVVQDVLEMRDQLYADNFFGPFMLYHSTNYDIYLDNDYFRTGGTSVNQSLRQRLLAIDGIAGVRRLDYLTSGFQLIMVQMTSDVARAIIGMDITTLQWETVAGLRLNFKVLCVMVPQLRADFDGRSGILHGTTS